jgi:hypothetical protein
MIENVFDWVVSLVISISVRSHGKDEKKRTTYQCECDSTYKLQVQDKYEPEQPANIYIQVSTSRHLSIDNGIHRACSRPRLDFVSHPNHPSTVSLAG